MRYRIRAITNICATRDWDARALQTCAQFTPIIRAAQNGHLVVALLLLQEGADPLSVDNELHNCLHWAVFHRHHMWVAFVNTSICAWIHYMKCLNLCLIACGKAPMMVERLYDSYIWCVPFSDSLLVETFFLENNLCMLADIDICMGLICMHTCRVVHWLLKQNSLRANINAADGKGATALHLVRDSRRGCCCCCCCCCCCHLCSTLDDSRFNMTVVWTWLQQCEHGYSSVNMVALFLTS